MDLENLVRPYIQDVAGRREVSFTLEKIVGDASSREYFRVRLRNGGDMESLVLMKFDPEGVGRSDEGTVEGDGSTGFPFTDVQRYLSQGGIKVPELYAAYVSRGICLLEDLADVQMFALVEDADDETRRRWYRRAIDVLVKIQTLARTRPDTSCVAFNRRFTHDLLMWEFDHYLEYGLEAMYETRLPDSDRGPMREAFDGICRELIELPQIFVHRDFQSRNIMVRDGELALIDFQDALIGPLPYDLVALLRDSYVLLDDSLVDELIAYYLEGCEAAGDRPIGREVFRRGFLLQTIQRKLKDAGRFVFIDLVKKNPFFLPFIPGSLEYVRRALGKLPEFHDLASRLARYEKRLSL